jgi:hypothetical protein
MVCTDSSASLVLWEIHLSIVCRLHSMLESRYSLGAYKLYAPRLYLEPAWWNGRHLRLKIVCSEMDVWVQVPS